jgi:ABC-type glycerol-3-phosphate transport system substrate-binding protein
MAKKKITRRQFIKGVAAGGAAVAGAMAAPSVVRKAYAAKPKLSIGLWNHWVPGATDVHQEIVQEWAEKNKVDVTVDLVGPQCRDIRTIVSAEARAGTGHDISAVCTFDATSFKPKLEPLNDVADYLMGKYGEFDTVSTYLCRQDGVWITLPAPTGSHSYPMVSRIDLWREHAGVDLVELFPPDKMKRNERKIKGFTYKAFLKYCEKLHAAGYPFGNPIAETSDGNDWLCPLMLSFGSVPVDKDGNITIESKGTEEGLEYLKELTQYMPKEIYGWDDASNNRWIISGKGSAIQNPPSAWTVAKRTRPDIAAQLWHHDTPRGPEGRYRGALPYNFCLWKWCKEKKAAKELLTYLLESPQQWKIFTAAQGYDMPQLKPMYAHPVWEEEGPPKGTCYNYIPRGDEVIIVGGWPAPPEIGVQIYAQHIIPVMVGKVTTGEMSPKEAMKWCVKELEMMKG